MRMCSIVRKYSVSIFLDVGFLRKSATISFISLATGEGM